MTARNLTCQKLKEVVRVRKVNKKKSILKTTELISYMQYYNLFLMRTQQKGFFLRACCISSQSLNKMKIR